MTFLIIYLLLGIGASSAAHASDERNGRIPSTPGFYVIIILIWPAAFMLAVMLALESFHEKSYLDAMDIFEEV